MNRNSNGYRDYLLASDFDQTLSFNDSGIILSELLGNADFEAKVKGMARTHLVQQGGELAYLLLHDPEYRRVRKEHLVETGRRIRLKTNIALFAQILTEGIEDRRFLFNVISAAPEEVVQSALEGIVPAERIFGTRFNYNSKTGEIESIAQFGRLEHADGPVVITVEPLHLGREIHEPRLLIDELLQLAPGLHPLERNTDRQTQFRQGKVRRVRVLHHGQRIVVLAQKTRMLPRRHRAVADHVGIRDRRR